MTSQLNGCPRFLLFLNSFFFLKLIVACRLCIYVREDNDSNLLAIHVFYGLHGPRCPRKAMKLNHSLANLSRIVSCICAIQLRILLAVTLQSFSDHNIAKWWSRFWEVTNRKCHKPYDHVGGHKDAWSSLPKILHWAAQGRLNHDGCCQRKENGLGHSSQGKPLWIWKPS